MHKCKKLKLEDSNFLLIRIYRLGMLKYFFKRRRTILHPPPPSPNHCMRSKPKIYMTLGTQMTYSNYYQFNNNKTRYKRDNIDKNTEIIQNIV